MTSAVKLNSDLIECIRNSGDHIIVTGATGWLGQAFLDAVTHGLGDKRRLHAFSSRGTRVELMDGTAVTVRPLSSLAELQLQDPCRIFHFAFLTKDKQGVMLLEEYAERNRAIRMRVSDALQRLDVRGLCLTSSGAVYNKDRTLQRDLAAYPYAALKVEEEEYFAQACAGRIPLLIPRIFNMSGPYINKWDAYALSSLLQMAMRGDALTINARHSVIRGYTHVGDIIAVMLGWLYSAGAGDVLTLDACMPGSVEIGELAKHACRLTGRGNADIRRDYDLSLPADTYLGDSDPFMRLCDEYGVSPLSLDAQIESTRAYMEAKSKLLVES